MFSFCLSVIAAEMILLTEKQLLTIALLLCIISSDEGFRAGLEFKRVKLCGPHDETAKFIILPWPFIASGKPYNVSMTFTPAVDVLAATAQWELKSESDEYIFGRGRDDMCSYAPAFCSLPAGESFKWTYSDVMRAIPPGFTERTVRAHLEVYNEEHIMFLCLDVVATSH
ncbi:hypothetical protein ACROYT_G004015 [Oculina patagonica]